MQPMAIVVLGGLITTTVVNLYLLPVLYLWLKPQSHAVMGDESPSATLRRPHIQLANGANGQPELAGQTVS
jgi:hypothetical protein